MKAMQNMDLLGSIRGFFFGIEWAEIELFLALCFWTFFVLYSVRFFECTSPLVGALFVVYADFVGIVMALALPGKYRNFADLNTMLLYFIAFSSLSGLWYLRVYIKSVGKE